jgi:hypothetical protein
VARHRVAIVGNASVRKDWGGIIDACNFVVRFNGCQTRGAGTGDRIDALALCNSAPDPTSRLMSFSHGDAFEAAGEIWLTRNPNLYQEYLSKAEAKQFRYTDIYRADPAEYLRHLQSIAKSYRIFEPEVEIRLRAAIADAAPRRRWLVPSTGALALTHCLSHFPQSEIVLTGFSFEGWAGHPWLAERRHLLNLAKAGRVTLLEDGFRWLSLPRRLFYLRKSYSRGYPLDGALGNLQG